MKKHSLLVVTTLVAWSSLQLQAGPKEDVSAAAKKLSESGGYSWTSTREGGFGGGTTKGKISADGTTVIEAPGRDGTFLIVRQGEKVVAETQDGWQSASELENAEGFGRFLGRMMRNLRLPAAEAEQLALGAESLAESDGAITGKLKQETVKEMLSFRGRGGDGPEVSDASGSVKLWIKDGQLVKYEYKLKGVMTFGGQDRDIDRTTTVEVKEVGSAKVEIPEGAKAKLK